ncbi:chromate transporter [Thauera chlorobenzoica]|uniref:Chromate transport family protein n=1 Tax=Thauera chlorobenzoica TaxID=96773 RepID=A0A1H5YAP5_9RHOO|nr:chromate transporter [Thauera chlorobenzoica]APR03111.1 chromate transport family protein [Thauera chlorobenzoica]SEG21159.1 chromate transporter [Thauera chlorobenzoica]
MTSVPRVTPPPASAARNHPRSPGALFVAFTLLALQGFGGVLAVAQRELVDRRGWLGRDEFIEAYSLAQLLPGPNVVNLSLMVGDRFFGWRGALAAISGMLLAPLVLVLAAAAGYQQLAGYPAVAGALRGMGAVAAGLILAMACKMLLTLRKNLMGPWLCALLGLTALIAVVVFRVPLAWIVIGLGLAGWSLARVCIMRQSGGPPAQPGNAAASPGAGPQRPGAIAAGTTATRSPPEAEQ